MSPWFQVAAKAIWTSRAPTAAWPSDTNMTLGGSLELLTGIVSGDTDINTDLECGRALVWMIPCYKP